MNLGALADNIVSLSDKTIKATKVKDFDARPSIKRDRNYAVVPWRAILDNRINKSAAMIVLITICGYTNRKGETWVGQQTIAEILGVSKQAIQKQVVNLVKAGHLQILEKAHTGRSARMRVIFDPNMTAADVSATIPARLQDDDSPVTKDAARAHMARIRAMLKGKDGQPPEVVTTDNPQELSPETTSKVVTRDNLEGVLRQPNEGLTTTSGSCPTEVECSIRKGSLEKKKNEVAHDEVRVTARTRAHTRPRDPMLDTLTDKWGIPDQLIRSWSSRQPDADLGALVAMGEIGAWEAVSST